MTIIPFLLIAIFTLSATAADDSGAAVSCAVIDSATGKGIAGVKIYCPGDTGRCGVCDEDGGCILSRTLMEACSLLVIAPQYDTVTLAAGALSGRGGVLAVKLRRTVAVTSLDKMVVKGKRQMQTDDFATTSCTKIDQSALLNMPGTANDINRVIAVHPSVLSAGMYNDNALYVRGGNPTENAYIIDGMIFDDINHYPMFNRPGGGFGFVDPDMVDNLEIFAGGIPVSLPPRTSSAIAIALRDGSTDRPVYKADLSIMGFGLAGEGPLPKASGSYLLSARYADMRFIRKLYEELGTPRYGDGMMKYVFDLKEGGALSLHAIGSFDMYRNLDGEPALGYAIDNYFQMRSNVEAGSLTWDKAFPLVFNTLQFSVSRTEAERSRVSTDTLDTLVLYSSSRRVPVFDTSIHRYILETTRLIGDTVYTDAVRKKNFYATDQVSFPLGEHCTVDAGLSGEIHRMYYRSQHAVEHLTCYYTADRETPVDELPYVNTGRQCAPAGGNYDRDTMVQSMQTAGYAQVSARIGPVTVVPGVRADYYALIDRGGVSPRLNIAWRSDALGTLAASMSVIRQLPTDFDKILSLLLIRDAIELQAPVEFGDIRLQRCFQATVAYQRTLGRFHTFTAEAYGKRYDHQYAYFTPDRRNVYTYYMYGNGNTTRLRIGAPEGKQRVHGVEATLAGDRSRRLFYSGAFSYSVSRHRYADSTWYTDEFGECKKASFLAGFTLSKGHVFTANFFAMTGRLYSKMDAGRYDLSAGYLSERLRPVYSLSARYTFEHRFRRMTLGAYLEAINILNQKQIIDRETDYGEYLDHKLVGIIPNVALMVSF